MDLFSLAFEKSVGAVVYHFSGNEPFFLVLQYRGGHWGFIKGHTEKGETDEQTLRREAEEETGLADLKIIPGFRSGERYYYRAKREEAQKRKLSGRGTRIFKRVVYYLAETEQVQIKLSPEHRNSLWLPYWQAVERVTNRNSQRVLEQAGRFLARHLPKGGFEVE